MRLTRRNLLRGVAAGAAATAAGIGLTRQRAQAADGRPNNYLIVLGAFGGASIIDSFMPIRESDVTPEIGSTLNVFPDEEVVTFADSPLRAVDRAASLFGETYDGQQSAFVGAHRHQMQVVTQTGTSVNHTVAQKRSITGNGAWAGRTLQECVAMDYGANCPLPNVTMGSLGFRSDGDDATVPPEARAEAVADPVQWPLALDGVAGVEGAPDREIVELARAVRNEQLDPESKFWQTFRLSDRLTRWKKQREDDLPVLEQADLMQKLNFGLDHPSLPAFDPTDLAALQSAFGYLTIDPLQSQAAMAYLLIKHGISVAVTLSPNWEIVTNPGGGGDSGEHAILNPPLSFDYSHTQHRVIQTIMWQRMLDTIDGLISLLSAAPHPGAPGDSLWDHTMIYVATDFGRTKRRPAGSLGFGSGHDLNNGNLLLSPTLLRGNTLLGGVDTSDGMTYGYDPSTGAAMPGTHMTEDFLFSGILGAMGVDTSGSGLPANPAMYA